MVKTTAANAPRKRYTFTLNNPSEPELAGCHTLGASGLVGYLIFGIEKGKSGTEHIQGFVNFKKKHRFNKVKKLISKRAHIEVARGTDLDNQRYCSKDGQFFEYGQPMQQGQRTDLSEIATELKENGGNLCKIAEANPAQFIRYHRGLAAFCDVMNLGAKRDFKTTVTVLVGPPGCGKSRYAAERCTDPYYKPNGDWWDGYCGQNEVIIDDFYGWLKCDELLRICDRYPHRVPIKGGFKPFVSRQIYITSNKHVEDWYKFETPALFRRISVYLVYDDDAFAERKDTPFPINF
jgi:hypothetical protein